MSEHHPPRPTHALTPGEIKQVTHYIGVESGYLGDFNRAELQTFYLDHGLDFDIDDYEGTTRARYVDILLKAPPDVQARILRATLDRFPTIHGSKFRTIELRARVTALAERCDGHMVTASIPADASAVVLRALADAEALLESTGATSGVDRLHTALHGYLKQACDSAGIVLSAKDPDITLLWSTLRQEHPRLELSGPQADNVLKIQRAFAKILDGLNPIRDRASMVHPNDDLLEPDEARLVINSVRTLLSYLEAKLR